MQHIEKSEEAGSGGSSARSRLVYLFVSLLGSTYRYRHVGVEHLVRASAASRTGGYLFGIWHQNVLAGILAQTGTRHVVIVSRSPDAAPVAFACSRLGHVVVRGSSRIGDLCKGGREAKEEMIEQLTAGIPGAVTVDGPKGPAKMVKPGIVDMARRSGAPIVPYAPIPERCWTFGSWDRFRLPKPFSRIAVLYGEPIPVEEGTEGIAFRELQSRLERALEEGERAALASFSSWSSWPKSRELSATES